MKYNKEKIKRFHEYTLKEYNESLIVEYIVKVNIVDKTDGTFTQIGIRPLLEDEIFISPSFSEYLPGSGRMIANGEMDFLIKKIVEKVDKDEIKKIELDEDLTEFPKHVFGFNEAVILLPNKFSVEILSKLMHRIDYKKGYSRLDNQYRLEFVGGNEIGDKIIVVDKDAIWWEKQKFYNQFTNKDEKIDFNIVPAKEPGKVDITIKSVNKIKSINRSMIKVLEIKKQI